MKHPERKLAKRLDYPGRSRQFTDEVYSGVGSKDEKWARAQASDQPYLPPASPYSLFVGDLHGHTDLSDGGVDIDTYFRSLRDRVQVDFAALTDHDHGGVGKKELWDGAWDQIREKVREYYEPGKFTTILGYERDSYPYYNNMVLYYAGDTGEMVRGVHDGEITERELRALLKRGDILAVPHDTYSLDAGADFLRLSPALFTPMIELYSRGDACEYFGNPAFAAPTACEGGFWRDALERGAKMGCIGASDDHTGRNGLTVPEFGYPRMYPGLTGVWAEENTREAIFAALKAKRTFAFMGGRMSIDFRVSDHFMGESFSAAPGEDVRIWFRVSADQPVKQITVIKNGRDLVQFNRDLTQVFFDNCRERKTDYYYLRVELTDGRFGWSSPVWVEKGKRK